MTKEFNRIQVTSEQGIIDRLQQAFASPDGIGDDAAIFPASHDESFVITKDLLAEDLHFRRRYFDAASLAHKSLHVNLSDVAAMGATPVYVLLGISLPDNLDPGYTISFLDEFTRLCKAADVALIGGDTTGSKHGMFISVTAIGRVSNSHLKLRRNAHPDDIVCICGDIGEAHAGLLALEKNMPGADAVAQKLLRPTARNKEGIWLGQQSAVTAMMDTSDGLHADLQKLCRASRVGADIVLDQLAPSSALARFCQVNNIDPLECMVAGGEDYGLLLTVRSDVFDTLASDFKNAFGYALKPVGRITAGADVRLMQQGQAIPFSYNPFSHFGE